MHAKEPTKAMEKTLHYSPADWQALSLSVASTFFA